MVRIFIDEPVPYWDKFLDVSELPDYEGDYTKTFGCLVATASTFLFPKPVSSYIMEKLAYAILDQKRADFVYKSYLPELQVALETVDVPLQEKLNFSKRFLGMGMKLGFAFLF